MSDYKEKHSYFNSSYKSSMKANFGVTKSIY